MHQVFGIILACLPALALAQQVRPDTVTASRVQVHGTDCALFPEGAAFDALELHDAAATWPYRFTPTSQQVEEVEKQFAEKGLTAIARPTFPTDSALALIQSYAPLAYIHAHLPTYKRQYYGFYNPQHQLCLFINLLEEPVPGWMLRYIFVLDGGAAFWRVFYNLVTHQFYGFGVNGEG